MTHNIYILDINCRLLNVKVLPKLIQVAHLRLLALVVLVVLSIHTFILLLPIALPFVLVPFAQQDVYSQHHLESIAVPILPLAWLTIPLHLALKDHG